MKVRIRERQNSTANQVARASCTRAVTVSVTNQAQPPATVHNGGLLGSLCGSFLTRTYMR
jgi:hypothetical protein